MSPAFDSHRTVNWLGSLADALRRLVHVGFRVFGVPVQGRRRAVPGRFGGPGRQDSELRETRIKTRRVVRAGGDVVYGADVETNRILSDEESSKLTTESHTGVAQAACGVRGFYRWIGHR